MKLKNRSLLAAICSNGEKFVKVSELGILRPTWLQTLKDIIEYYENYHKDIIDRQGLILVYDGAKIRKFLMWLIFRFG